MRDDLLHAQASIDWAVSRFPSFDDRILLWLNENIKTVTRELEPENPNDLLVATEKEPLPLSFTVEAGAYVHCIRSALDILAIALAQRHQMPKLKDIYFPAASSEIEFRSGRGYKGAALVNGLPTAERAIIESLQPYRGGNETLWALHRLDITRKHHRLLETALWPRSFAVMGWWKDDEFTPAHDWVNVNGETVLGFLKKGANAKIYFTPVCSNQ